ncbi:uncharacterized protein LOC128235886 [Mya arenaria]|uniref:uncharacterized protein LOC128235886 n=1 Tax=Mya arenaria TaxID=6604 RepID=UPI0022E77574|nr:uncharacterized protein LOC128235886 [Mya arenaria]
MGEKAGFMFISFLQLILYCESTDVVLSTDRTFVTENYTMTFTCSTMNNDSVINIDLIQNEAIISKMGYQDSACKIIVFSNTMTNCSCVNLNTYTCTTDPMTRLNNTDLWTCNATVEGLVFQSNIVSIDVRVPIVSVIISPDSDKYMTLNEEDELLLTCEASYGMPAANITWFMNNKTTDFNGSFIISNSSIINVTENEDGTKKTQSTLTYSVGRKDHGMEVYCNAMQSAMCLGLLVNGMNRRVPATPLTPLDGISRKQCPFTSYVSNLID